MSRSLNSLETKLHQAALAAPRQELTPKDAEKLIPDSKARQNALNFLLGVGYFKALKDSKNNALFRAVTKVEHDQTKDLTGDEVMVLAPIKASTNEGIWIKHLKAKTNLHQTVIEKCVKSLVQKRLIKQVASVQHPTRKIYMLEGVEPSVALTGGPWYTENELDTDFIASISQACLKCIRDISYPRNKTQEGAIYSISNAPQYPSASQIHKTLQQARLTQTDLTVEHIEILLEVLVLDGEIEKLPAFGASLWDSNAVSDGDSEEEDRESRKKKKRRRAASSDSDDAPSRRKHKKKQRADSDTETDSDDDRRSRKKSKLKRKKHDDSTSADSDDEDDSERDSKKKKKKKGKKLDDSDSDSEEESSKKKKKKKVKYESDSDDDNSRRRKKSVKRSPSPFDYGGASVYRAVRQEKLNMGWAEAPCSQCASFDFCKEGAPVNASECVYYGDWLVAGTITFDPEP
ncbi:RNA polymerase III subunit RPC34 [Mycena indigotica]|uniref:RNA polymerase III subunit RPC34 n=1 Tax=Mycena indigotica TaxID=2126181 RepID=A0A8H6SL79_9AGAR|nr:RNA polymerase III subunit RPC34 [Mycena indigotica]KAF7301461.1 RNA polymerase III subunit RPC34 [Mycena indigotica]